MSESNNHINYSAADIEKYWKGQLSAAEQHAMEKAALEDHFLSDAMDGYEENALKAKSLITADNNELQKRLVERIKEKNETPVIKFSWWKVAAAVIVLIGGTWLYTSSVSNKNKNQELVKNEPPKEKIPAIIKADTIKASTGAINDSIAVTDVAINKPDKKTVENKNFASRDKDKAAATETESSLVSAEKRTVPATAPVTSQVERADLADTVIDKNDVVKETILKREPGRAITADHAEQKATGFAADDYKANNNAMARKANANNSYYTNTFKGNLTDQSNRPIGNAFIQIPNLNIATKTDKRGYFSFNAEDTTLSVSIASDGFETQNLNLRNKAVLNQIVLKPVPDSLREVVVQSNGADIKKKSAANGISIKILDAEPAIGWNAYNEYLRKNKKVDNDLRNIHGTVIVSFEVRNNWLTNFTIEQSLDEDLDAEAIRLIKEGPTWKLLKGKKAIATVNVKF